jgi:hypothetical protein
MSILAAKPSSVKSRRAGRVRAISDSQGPLTPGASAGWLAVNAETQHGEADQRVWEVNP